MPEHPTTTTTPALRWRRSAFGLLALFLVSFLVLLLRNFSMKVWSDPVHWFTFGIDFPSRFAHSHLAYGFPLVVYLAVGWLGPYLGFLVNIPILVLLVGVFTLFAGMCAGEDERPAWLTGLVAAGLFVVLNKALLIELASPYRDPLAFLFMLTAATLFVLHFESERPRWIVLAASGLCLAYAVSCRETAGLIAAPLGLYAIAARWRAWGLRFWISLAWFGFFLAAGCVPWLVQNYLVAGNPIVPAQSAEKVQQAASLIGMLPGHREGPRVLPTLLYLRDHYSWFGIAAAAVGLAAGRGSRGRPRLTLCLPAALVFFLFYMFYQKTVPRYLLVIDLFVVPLMACGIMTALRGAVGLLRPGSRTTWPAAAAAAFAATVSIWMLTRAPSQQRFLPAHARAFVEAVDTRLEPGARVVCERPVEGLLQCFSHTRAHVLQYLGRHRVFQDASKWLVLRAWTEERPVYLASLSDPVRSYVERAFDLDEAFVLDTSTFNLDTWFAVDAVRFDRVRPWSNTLAPVVFEDGGTQAVGEILLEVDAGHLSAYERTRVTLSMGDNLLDGAPQDNLNFYRLTMVAPPPGGSMTLASDGPLPRLVSARFRPALAPLLMDLRDEALVPWRNRFSEAWLERPRDRYPSVANAAGVLLPTPGTNAWAVALQMRASGDDDAPEPCSVSVTSPRGALLGAAAVGAEGWSQVPVFLPEGEAVANNSLVQVAVTGTNAGPCRVWLRRVLLQPLGDGEEGLRIEVGRPPEDLVYLGRGFFDAEQGPQGRYRWTGGQAKACFFLPRVNEQVVLRVTYRDPHPPGVPPAELACALNGDVLRMTSLEEAEGWHRWYAVAPASVLQAGVNRLVLETRTWVPAEALPGSRDRRALGVQVQELRLIRPAARDPASDGSRATAPG